MKLLDKIKQKGSAPKQEPVVIGAHDSDLIEIKEHGKVHYKVQTVSGLRQLLTSIEAERGRGVATLDWWVAGLHFKLSAEIPLDILEKVNGQLNDR